MKKISILLTLSILISCATDKTPDTLKTDILSFSIQDSLNKYSTLDSIMIRYKVVRTDWTVDTSSTRILDEDGNPPYVEFRDTIDAYLYMGKANNKHYGFTLNESKITFYQKTNNNWIITDSVDFFEQIGISQMDINGDSYMDLRISKLHDPDNGDVLTCVFLYDSLSNRFKHNPSFGQANIEYDYKKNFVKFWIGCKKEQRGVKWRGIVVDDILKVDSTVTFHIETDKATGLKKAIMEIYKGPNGASYKPIISENGDPEYLWMKFSKTFWESN